jgi:hypothetical protein
VQLAAMHRYSRHFGNIVSPSVVAPYIFDDISLRDIRILFAVFDRMNLFGSGSCSNEQGNFAVFWSKFICALALLYRYHPKLCLLFKNVSRRGWELFSSPPCPDQLWPASYPVGTRSFPSG